ncbi:major facilitator superfamily domain-containing protein [Cladochytrium replicatum]|nr:major facilitator superfamily domain-containing protein [Cladochytrium replicatum]
MSATASNDSTPLLGASHRSSTGVRSPESNRQADGPHFAPKTSFPYRQLFVIAAVSFAEPLGASIISPFIYQMIRSFKVTEDEKNLGYYVGLITSIFSFAQVISSIPIGSLSDRYGRRPMMLIGLLCNCVSFVFFGLSSSLIWALSSRAALGLLNGNTGIAKSMLGEITDHTNRARSFSVIGLTSALGGIAIFVFAFFNLPETLGLLNGRKVEHLVDVSSTGKRENLRVPWRAFVPIVCLFFLAFETIIFNGVFPLYASTPIEDGGLQLDTKQLGMILTINSSLVLLSQVLIYPRVASALGPLKTYRLGVLPYIPINLIFPFISLMVRDRTQPLRRPSILYFTLSSLMSLKASFSNYSFTSTFILINNSAPTPRLLGTINGFGQTGATLARTIGPTIGGSLWAWSLSAGLSFPFNYHLVYNLIAVVGMIMYLWSYLIPPDERSKSEEIEFDEENQVNL